MDDSFAAALDVAIAHYLPETEFARKVKPAAGQKSMFDDEPAEPASTGWDESKVVREKTSHDDRRPGEFASHEQAQAKADHLNATTYKDSRIDVAPMRYGNTHVMVGVAKKQASDLESQYPSLAEPEEPTQPLPEPEQHWYGMRLRPPSLGAIPKGDYDHKPHEEFRHGQISYGRKLSDQEVDDYQLTPIRNDSEIPELTKKFAAGMGKYAAEYAKPENDEYLNEKLNQSEARMMLGHVDPEKIKAELRKQHGANDGGDSFDRINTEAASIADGIQKQKDRSMIYQADAKEEMAKKHGKPLDAYHNIPFADWQKIQEDDASNTPSTPLPSGDGGDGPAGSRQSVEETIQSRIDSHQMAPSVKRGNLSAIGQVAHDIAQEFLDGKSDAEKSQVASYLKKSAPSIAAAIKKESPHYLPAGRPKTDPREGWYINDKSQAEFVSGEKAASGHAMGLERMGSRREAAEMVGRDEHDLKKDNSHNAASASVPADIAEKYPSLTEPEAEPKPASSRSDRDAKIDEILAVARKPAPHIRENFRLQGSDGGWYSAHGFPHGVTHTGEKKSTGFSFSDKSGVTFGTPASSAEELTQRHNANEDKTAAEFREHLLAADDEGFQSQHDYWMGQKAKDSRLNAPMPSATPKAKPAPLGMDGKTREQRKAGDSSRPPMPQVSIDMMDKAIAARDAGKVMGMVDPSNKGWRAQFEAATGVKLPKTIRDTKAAVQAWATAESVAKQYPSLIEPKAEQSEPEAGDWTPENHVKIAADSIEKLRGQDVHRLMDSAPPARMEQMARHILKHRPELSRDIHDARIDIEEERGAGANAEAEKPTEQPKDEAKPSPWHASRPEVFEAMHRADDKVSHEWQKARDLAPRGGTTGVGGADFDHTLKASVGEEYLRTLNKGGTPAEALAAAEKAGREAVANWNNKTSKGRAAAGGSHELKRWENAGDSHALGFHQMFNGFDGEKSAAPRPQAAAGIDYGLTNRMQKEKDKAAEEALQKHYDEQRKWKAEQTPAKAMTEKQMVSSIGVKHSDRFAKMLRDTGWFTDARMAMKAPEKLKAKLAELMPVKDETAQSPKLQPMIDQASKTAGEPMKLVGTNTTHATLKAKGVDATKESHSVLLADSQNRHHVLDAKLVQTIRKHYPGATFHATLDDDGKPSMAIAVKSGGETVALVMEQSLDGRWHGDTAKHVAEMRAAGKMQQFSRSQECDLLGDADCSPREKLVEALHDALNHDGQASTDAGEGEETIGSHIPDDPQHLDQQTSELLKEFSQHSPELAQALAEYHGDTHVTDERANEIMNAMQGR